MAIIDNETWRQWMTSPVGRYALDWEQSQFDAAVADLFGEIALQIGMPGLPALRTNRMHVRAQVHLAGSAGCPRPEVARRPPGDATRAAETPSAAGEPAGACGGDGGDGAVERIEGIVVEGLDELPFRPQSVDLVVMPHVLEFAHDPHQTLREVERILRPEGRVVVCGFNPVSLWGVRAALPASRQRQFLPADGALIGLPRLRDWLKLLGLQIERGRYGCYRPPFSTQKWLDRTRWLEAAGDRWWPICGAVYCVSAVKRVEAVRLVGPAWRRRVRRPAVAIAAQSASLTPAGEATCVQRGGTRRDTPPDA